MGEGARRAVEGKEEMTRFVIHCEAMGVYIGPIYGNKQLWAKTKRDNLRCAAQTFTTAAEAMERAVELWKHDATPPVCRAIEVQADCAGYATLAACVASGLPETPDDPDFVPEPGADWLRHATVLDGGRQ